MGICPMVTIPGIEPGVSTLKGLRVSQFHYMVLMEAPLGLEPRTFSLTD